MATLDRAIEISTRDRSAVTLNVIGSGEAREKAQKEPNGFIFHCKNHHKRHVMLYTANVLTYQYRTASQAALQYKTVLFLRFLP